ncbi:MAG: hypothetical protein CME65_07480 [Halobacteriovoraceae bacterium]|nr:hypothetical protein [Halobacteriovoraceae bacterium]|tara:strand:- start:19311 stop:20381 length:1071 start_codon:yes stop_codon:yes gene_type:complete
MRILHICQFLGVGGLEQVLFLLAKEQINQGHSVELCVYDHDRRWVEKFELAGVKVHKKIQKKPGIDLSLLKKFKPLIDNAEIVHTHDLNPGFYLSLYRLRYRARRKTFKFIHTTHGMEHIQEEPKTRIFEAILGIMADRILTVSPKFQQFYQNQVFTKFGKVKLIENGTEIDKRQNYPKPKRLLDDLGLSPSLPVALYIARVVPLKGQLEMIEIYRKLNHQLLLVGPSGNDQYLSKCKTDLPSHIKFLGNRDDINDLIDLSDYYISHSFHEGLPISVLEAGARNKPCLLYDIPGHSQFNHHKNCVLLFDSQNFESKLQELMNSRTELTRNFFDLIEAQYSSKAMTNKVLKSYEVQT